MESRYLSDWENKLVKETIEKVIEEEKEFSEGIFLNYYRIKDVDYIDIQCIKNDLYSKKYMGVPCSVENLVICKVYVPSLLLSSGMNHHRRECDIMNLSNGEIVMDRDDDKYKNLTREADDFGFGTYTNNVKFYPPLNFKRVKKLN